MKNYYSTVDDIVMTFSDLENDGMFDSIRIRFERARAGGGFDFAEGRLPDGMFFKSYGFSEDELMELETYMKNNAFLIWELAYEKGGMLHFGNLR